MLLFECFRRIQLSLVISVRRIKEINKHHDSSFVMKMDYSKQSNQIRSWGFSIVERKLVIWLAIKTDRRDKVKRCPEYSGPFSMGWHIHTSCIVYTIKPKGQNWLFGFMEFWRKE